MRAAAWCKALRASVGDPDAAPSNLLTGDSFTSKLEVQEQPKALILLREVTNETKIDIDGFVSHTACDKDQDGAFLG